MMTYFRMKKNLWDLDGLISFTNNKFMDIHKLNCLDVVKNEKKGKTSKTRKSC